MIKRQNFPRTALYRSSRTEFSCQCKKLFGAWHCINAVDRKLALADHVHQLDAGEYRAGRPERFEVEHRPGHPLDGAVILLDNVVEVFNLAHRDRHVAAGIDRIPSRLVSAALVHRDFVWIAVYSNGLVEEAHAASMSRCAVSRKFNGLALLVDGAVEVFFQMPLTLM